jgi:hypothetical protein
MKTSRTTIGSLRRIIREALAEEPTKTNYYGDPTDLTNSLYAYDIDNMGLNEPYAPGQPFDYRSMRPEDVLLYLGFTRDAEDKNKTHPAACGKKGVAARTGTGLQPTSTKDLLP